MPSDGASPSGNTQQNVTSSSSSYVVPEVDASRTVRHESSANVEAIEARYGAVNFKTGSIVTKDGEELEIRSFNECDGNVGEAERIDNVHPSRSDSPFGSSDVTRKTVSSDTVSSYFRLENGCESERTAVTGNGAADLSTHRLLVRELPWHETGYQRSSLVSMSSE
jgi:hypothetical protein